MVSIFGRARASIQRRIKKKIRDWQAQQREKQRIMRKIKAAQKKAYYEELEKAAIERARERAREKARETVKKGMSWSERLIGMSEATSPAKLLGFEPNKKAVPPSDVIWSKKKRD